jgi:hypothetical protein
MNLGSVASQIKKGETVTFKAVGNSMDPRIKNGEMVTVSPVGTAGVWIGDVVLAKVKGRWFLHLVTGISGRRIQISNNKGHVNGWTAISNVIGIAQL